MHSRLRLTQPTERVSLLVSVELCVFKACPYYPENIDTECIILFLFYSEQKQLPQGSTDAELEDSMLTDGM